MPGRMCTGNPNHTGTVSVRCHNTWLLCLPANFLRRLKVDRGGEKKKKNIWEKERGRGGKRRDTLFYARPLTVFAGCLAKSQAERCPHFIQILSEVLVSAQQAELFVRNQRWIFRFSCDNENIVKVIQKAYCEDKKSRRGGGRMQKIAFMYFTFRE